MTARSSAVPPECRTPQSLRLDPELLRDWSALGEDAFDFEVLAELGAPEAPGQDVSDDLAVLESLWLDELKPWGDRGYNRPPEA